MGQFNICMYVVASGERTTRHIAEQSKKSDRDLSGPCLSRDHRPADPTHTDARAASDPANVNGIISFSGNLRRLLVDKRHLLLSHTLCFCFQVASCPWRSLDNSAVHGKLTHDLVTTSSTRSVHHQMIFVFSHQW